VATCAQAKIPRGAINRRLVGTPLPQNCLVLSENIQMCQLQIYIYKSEVKLQENLNSETEDGFVEIFPLDTTGCRKLSGTGTAKKS
jgi:hypothetical protein